MADRPHIPQDDRDLNLALEIESCLNDRADFSDIGDPLMPALLAFRQAARKRAEEHRIDSASLWNEIERQTRTETGTATDSKTPVRTLPSTSGDHRRIWAAAATILIIITAGLSYYIWNSSQPALIAQTVQATQRVTLDDGSTVTLRPHSKFYLVDSTPRRTVYELTGEGYFEVQSDPDRTFSVIAGNGRVSVLGTTFVLSSWGDLVQVYLQEGSVAFETTDHASTAVLEPGQYATIRDDELTAPRAADTDLFTDWLRDELSFRNQPARYVFSELEQHFNITITAPDTVSETRIGGRLNLETMEASLNDLGMVLGGKFEATGERHYTFVSDN